MPSARSRQTLPSSLRFEGIGTSWQIDTAEPLPKQVAESIEDRIELFDHTWSRFREDSLVSRLAVTPGIHEFPDDANALFELYHKLYNATDGAVSPLVGRALESMGYDRAYSLRPAGAGVAVPRWEDSMSWDGRALSTMLPVVLDVGAAGKGYLADIVAKILQGFGIVEYTVDASGDLVHRGNSPLRVALEHPLDSSRAIGIVNLRDGALCASASNRRAWGNGQHHILDAITGLPARRVLATWAIAETGLVSDGLATALFFADPERLAELFVFRYVRMFSDGHVEFSRDLDGELFT